jgi:glutamate decarboxylase
LTNVDQDKVYNPAGSRYGARYGTSSVPKYKIPTDVRGFLYVSRCSKLILSQGINEDTAYQIIHDELALDGQPLLNLASFVQTWMPSVADKLMLENISKNLIDQDEYPATQDIHTRCE